MTIITGAEKPSPQLKKEPLGGVYGTVIGFQSERRRDLEDMPESPIFKKC